jgi:hypothetical protein
VVQAPPLGRSHLRRSIRRGKVIKMAFIQCDFGSFWPEPFGGRLLE